MVSEGNGVVGVEPEAADEGDLEERTENQDAIR